MCSGSSSANMAKEWSTLVFYVNGKKVEDPHVDPEWTLLYYLRNKLRLCGTKLGCGEGGCGACTVMVSKMDRGKRKINHIPVNACLAPICSMHGTAVTTVEGIGSTGTKLHPVQERIAKSHGSQCGFCTPGIVMSMYTLLRTLPKPSMHHLEVALQGNLCRCTGYRPIIEGFKTFTEDWELLQNGHRLQNGTNGLPAQNGCSKGANCCKLQTDEEILYEPSAFTPLDPSQEPIFPPELKLNDKYDAQYLVIRGRVVTWYRPTSFSQLLGLKQEFPHAKIVVGNTEIGVETKFKNMVYPVIIQPVCVKEMTEISCQKDHVRVGAAATLTEMETFLKEQIRRLPEDKTRVFQTIVQMLHWFAGFQIRSVGAIGGNIMTGSPISDMLPILMANEVGLEVTNAERTREVRLDHTFFTGYRRTILESDEVLVAIKLPYTHQDRYSYAFKQARRREDDIAIVNTAIAVSFEPQTDIIQDINVAFGGMSFKTVTALKTREKLKGLRWSPETLDIAFTHLEQDLPLDSGAPGGMILYRRSLTLSLFFKGFLTIASSLARYIPERQLGPRELSALRDYGSGEYKSSQYFTVVPDTQVKTDSVQRPIVHVNAYKQAAGEAIYTDDIPFFENELYFAFVLSTKAYAKILKVDPSDALSLDGVHDFISAKDLKLGNAIGSVVHDEQIFYDVEVSSQGQILGGIVAIDQATAQRAAKKVKVEYEELHPVIVTIQDAIKHSSYLGDKRVLETGNVEEVFKAAEHVIEDECQMGGQEHFYLETQAVIVVPKKEDNELDVYSSTQNPTEVQAELAKVFGILQNKIVVKVKRIGGGFGGKESKAMNVAIPVAVAAMKLGRPIRCMLDRDEDMMMTGGRHPFYFRYKVAFNTTGKILAAHFKIYNNCGYSYDLSAAVLERAMSHCENAYKIPHLRVEGYLCKTHLPSNTAFRGFGGPQGMFATECMLENIAGCLDRDPMEISALNLYQEGDTTHYNQELIGCTIQKCWDECVQSSQYEHRRREIDKFNAGNKYKKRGLSILPTKYGISFTVPFLNQGGALVLVYADGSVLLSHGGIEIGQGLYTKMIQVASRSLGVAVEKIHIMETATDKVPNTSPTAASCGSDLNGMAVMRACDTIRERLKPVIEANPTGTWEQWIKSAYLSRISLSATGYYATPGIGYNWKTGQGNMFSYYTYGVGCCQVEIDTLTGDHEVQSMDIVMDLGESINPAIDIGQIEGAFMQGYGLFVLEELVYSPAGTIFTRGPGTYKIPGFGDIPKEFNVSLLKGVSNPRAVYSSKAVGEPPLFLGCVPYFAIKDAIKAARAENGLPVNFNLLSPATAERIRMSCADNITSRFKVPEPGSFKPWNVFV